MSSSSPDPQLSSPSPDPSVSTLSPSVTFVSTGSIGSQLSASSTLPSVSSTLFEPDSVSDYEKYHYYHGISSSPPELIYRSSRTPFFAPQRAEAYSRERCLLPVYDHAIRSIWYALCTAIVSSLDALNVLWSTIDVVRFGTYEHRGAPMNISPIILWIGVLPDTLSYHEASKSCSDILVLLSQYNLDSIEVEYRSSKYKTLARSPGSLYNPLVVDDQPALEFVIGPMTTALGIPIASHSQPHYEGTLGFYLSYQGNLLAVTARHTLFGAEDDNFEYNFNPDDEPMEVLLMGPENWNEYYNALSWKVNTASQTRTRLTTGLEQLTIKKEEMCMSGSETKVDTSAIDIKIEKAQKSLDRATDDLNDLQTLFNESVAEFNHQDQRKIGRVLWAPPIVRSAEPDGFTQDICVIQLDKARFEENDKGNVIDLGPNISGGRFTEMMNPTDKLPLFEYPEDHLLPFTEILPSTSFGQADSAESAASGNCDFVIKHGRSTNTTIGRANGIMSFTRTYDFLGSPSSQDSMEWAILPYDTDHSPFSKEGDSGSAVVTGTGKLGGLLVGGGSGKLTNSSDITYATPMYRLWPIIQARFPGATLHMAQQAQEH